MAIARRTVLLSLTTALLLCLGGLLHAQQTVEQMLFPLRQFAMISSAAMADASIITCGYYNDTRTDGLLLKTDSLGKMQWALMCTNPNWQTIFNSVTLSSDATVIVTGSQYDSTGTIMPLVCCVSADGKLLWSRQYHSDLNWQSISHCATSDGGIVQTLIALKTDSTQATHYVTAVLKIDRSGEPLWCYDLHHSANYESVNYQIIECRDSSLALTGYVRDINDVKVPAISSFLLGFLRLEQTGIPRSEVLLQSVDQNINPSSLIQTSDGGFIIGAVMNNSNPFEATQSTLAVRLDPAGQWKWANTFNFFTSERLQQLAQLPSGDILSLSISQSEGANAVHLSTFDISGTLTSVTALMNRQSSGASIVHTTSQSTPYTVLSTVTAGGNIALYLDITTLTSSFAGCGVTQTLGTGAPVALSDTTLEFRYSPVTFTSDSNACTAVATSFYQSLLCSTIIDDVTASPEAAPYSVSPNPVRHHGILTLNVGEALKAGSEIILRDLTGREVYRSIAESGAHSLQIPTGNLPAGVYSIEVVQGTDYSERWRQKIVLE